MLWEKSFGRRQSPAETAKVEQAAVEKPPRPFSDFADPFAGGQAEHLSPKDLVSYSFEAFEAWAREHQCPRSAEQTPHEFAAQVGTNQKAIARDARNLAVLYARAAYARDSLSAESVAHLRSFWQKLAALSHV